jgi:hypothetical protein
VPWDVCRVPKSGWGLTGLGARALSCQAKRPQLIPPAGSTASSQNLLGPS